MRTNEAQTYTTDGAQGDCREVCSHAQESPEREALLTGRGGALGRISTWWQAMLPDRKGRGGKGDEDV
jgi:hypothetical protein